MTPIQSAGLCRLILRLPAWRAALRTLRTPLFLDQCEAYALTWQAIAYWSRHTDAERVNEYLALADALEKEALRFELNSPCERPSALDSGAQS